MKVDDSVSDAMLIRNCRQGDEESFNVLYQRYRLPLYSYLHKILPSTTGIVDDVFQKTWMRALKNLDGYADRQKFVSWLFRIAHNLAIDHYRKEKRFESVTLNDAFPDEAEQPWESLDRQAAEAALQQTIETLSPEQREVLALRQNGVPFKQIAEIQQTSVNTVLGRMHYAVKHLQKRLKAYR